MADAIHSRAGWATLIRAVRTPLSFFTLALLVAQAILLSITKRAAGTDFTILLSSTLALTFLLVLAVAWLQYRSQAKREFELVADEKQKTYKYDVFLSVPMAAVGDTLYETYRSAALEIIECLKKQCNMKLIYYAGEQIATRDDFDPQDAAALDDLDAIQESKYFVMLYPKKVASSILFEAGIALALGKRSVYFVKKRKDLPFLMQKAEQAFDRVKLYEYDDVLDIQGILKNPKCFDFAPSKQSSADAS
ncbi:MAG TPA: hypothetical protein VNA69_23830 [Thermoanaerobaculia bacterium]|nr:hypothetical protein [Thermoanaerobaculia bacterium]